jgi:hypothetical protein
LAASAISYGTAAEASDEENSQFAAPPAAFTLAPLAGSRVIAIGLPAAVLRRLLCWSLFWHALDIVWVGVFTLVYLMGDWH